MENQMLSLYDYLGKAAGGELGQMVFRTSQIKKIKVEVKEVEKTVYQDKPETLQRIKDLEFDLDQIKQQNNSLNQIINDLNSDITDENRIKELEKQLYEAEESLEIAKVVKTDLMAKIGELSKPLTEMQKKEIAIEYVKNLLTKIFKRK
jgi:uncharacterized membrane-anchored protein YjiN (DUF445 family)